MVIEDQNQEKALRLILFSPQEKSDSITKAIPECCAMKKIFKEKDNGRLCIYICVALRVVRAPTSISDLNIGLHPEPAMDRSVVTSHCRAARRDHRSMFHRPQAIVLFTVGANGRSLLGVVSIAQNLNLGNVISELFNQAQQLVNSLNVEQLLQGLVNQLLQGGVSVQTH